MSMSSSRNRDRVYVVEPNGDVPDDGQLHAALVRSNHPRNALYGALKGMFSVRMATQSDMEKYLGLGVKVKRYMPKDAEVETRGV
jgi:hypothetical protein